MVKHYQYYCYSYRFRFIVIYKYKYSYRCICLKSASTNKLHLLNFSITVKEKMADNEVKWEATLSGQTTLFFFVLFFKISLYVNILSLTGSPPKKQKVYWCHFLSLCRVPLNLRMDSILIRKWNQDVRWALQQICPHCDKITFTIKLSCVLVNFFYIDIYIPFVDFHTCFSPQWQCASKRERCSCIPGGQPLTTHS